MVSTSILGDDSRADTPAARAAAATPAGRTYLRWARFPMFDIEWADACRVRLVDARYHEAAWAQALVVVNVPREECR
jgi:hypothetical protein